MFEHKFGRTGSHTAMAAGSVADTSESQRSGRREQMIDVDENSGAVPGTTVVTGRPNTLISKCLICRYRKPAGRTGESANA